MRVEFSVWRSTFSILRCMFQKPSLQKCITKGIFTYFLLSLRGDNLALAVQALKAKRWLFFPSYIFPKGMNQKCVLLGAESYTNLYLQVFFIPFSSKKEVITYTTSGNRFQRMTIKNENISFKSVPCAIYLKKTHGFLTKVCFSLRQGLLHKEKEKKHYEICTY